MIYRIEWDEKADKEFRKLDNSVRKQIVKFLEKTSILINPRSSGKDLKNTLSGFRRYHVGSYRLIVKIQDDKLIILVLEV